MQILGNPGNTQNQVSGNEALRYFRVYINNYTIIMYMVTRRGGTTHVHLRQCFYFYLVGDNLL